MFTDPENPPFPSVTQGETREELAENLREAVAGWLQVGEATIEIEPGSILEVAA